MTLQEMFNKAFLGLASQGFQKAQVELQHRDMMGNLRVIRTCVYLADDGTRCAVGHLLPDIARVPRHLRMASVKEPQIEQLLCEAIGHDMSLDERIFLGFLQEAHDREGTPAEMRKRLENVAAEFQLTVPELPAEEEAPIPVEPSFESLMAPVLSTREATPSPA